jgi:steroid 5-alpha reductase family enzyme
MTAMCIVIGFRAGGVIGSPQPVRTNGRERMHGLAATLLLSLAAVLAFLVLAWLLSLRLRDVSIVDVAWGPAFVLVAWIAAATGEGDAGRRLLLAVLVTVWGLRLAGYLAARKLRHRGEDPRYGAWREKHGDRFWLVSLFNVFLLQAMLVWIVSLPVQGASARDGALGALDAAGVALWAVGLFFEAVGDAQMARFKADPRSRGTVMDRGLWRYTRHPNYFGDFCVWWGIALIAVSAGAWWTLPGPVVMSLLLTRVSGKDHLERTLSARPGYAEYVRRTSGFVPLPPR